MLCIILCFYLNLIFAYSSFSNIRSAYQAHQIAAAALAKLSKLEQRFDHEVVVLLNRRDLDAGAGCYHESYGPME